MIRTRCPVCDGDMRQTLVRAGVPVFQNAVYRSASAARAAVTGDMVLAACSVCDFVFNAAFDTVRVVYGRDYENDQSYSEIFSRHMDAMADNVLAALPPQGGTIVEIGCGQGSFLELLMRRRGTRRLRLHGCDPSYRGGALPEDVSISSRLFDRDTMLELGTEPDAVVSRHVIEHVPDISVFLLGIREALGAKRDVSLFVETPCFDWIAANQVMQDVFYEHVNYSTAATLSFALQRTGFAVEGVRHVFGGQYLWATATPTDHPAPEIKGSGTAAGVVSRYADGIGRQVADWRARLSDGVPTALWGAGAKGVTFTGLVDPDRTRILCLIDRNPKKQDTFVPATGHPVVSPDEALRLGVRRVLVMNPNYVPEIRNQIAAEAWPLDLLEAGGPTP